MENVKNNYNFIRKTDNTHIIRLRDIPFFGDFVLLDKDNNNAVIFTSKYNNGDIPPLLAESPVLGITTKDDVFIIEITTSLYMN